MVSLFFYKLSGIVITMYTILSHETNPALREKARHIPIKDITSPEIRQLLDEMQALLSVEEHGVALAAPQVGEAIQLFIIAKSVFKDEKKSSVRHLVYINPRITKTSRSKEDKHEGCLSIRGLWGYVPRADKVTIEAYDEYGVKFSHGASGLLAHIFQHEVDHLHGILYIDKAVSVTRDEASMI